MFLASHKNRILLALLAGLSLLTLTLKGCTSAAGDPGLVKNVKLELVDWHVSGLWVINCPVAWLRVTNYNGEPIRDVSFTYHTYDYEGHPLNTGTYSLEGEIPARSTKNFAEQYLGLVELESEKLSVQLDSVRGD